MSGIWPFFNSSFSNASINKILVQIDQDAQRRDLLQQQRLKAHKRRARKARKPRVDADGDVEVEDVAQSPTQATSHEVAYSQGSGFEGSASELLAKIQTQSQTRPKPGSEEDAGAKSDSPAASDDAPTLTVSPKSSEVKSEAPSKDPQDPQDSQDPKDSQDPPNPENLPKSSGSENPPKSAESSQSASTDKSGSSDKSGSTEPSNPTSTNPNSADQSEEEIRPFDVALLNKLLDHPGLMDEINLAKNQRLINYISQPDVLDVLCDYILCSLDLSHLKEADSETLKMEIFAEWVEPKGDESDSDLVLKSPTDEEPLDKLTPLEKALQRASVASEILILPNTNILPHIMGSQPLMTKLWRGFFDRDVKCYFSEPAKTTATASSHPAPHTDEASLVEEEQYERKRFKESHASLLFNNYLKLVDDMAALNMNELMNFIRFEQPHCTITSQFLKFIPFSPTTCDLLVRLISTDKPYNPNGLIDILMDQNLILRLFRIAKDHYLDHQVQDNLCNLLNGIVGISSNVGFWDDPAMGAGGQQLNEFGEPVDADQANLMRTSNPNVGPNSLTRQLVSKQCVLEMLDIIINYGHYGLVTVVSVVIEVIRKNNSDYDEFNWIGCVSKSEEDEDVDKEEEDESMEEAEPETAETTTTTSDQSSVQSDSSGAPLQRTEPSEAASVSAATSKPSEKNLPNPRDPIYLGVMLKLFSLKLGDIVNNYLTDHYFEIREVAKLPAASGEQIEPLGYERFKTMELIAELLHCSNMILLNKSLRLDKLLYERELLRDVKHTRDLVKDAISVDINGDSAADSPTDTVRRQVEELSLEQSSSVPESVESDSSVSSSSPAATSSYVAIPSGLSIGNFFKLNLLQTQAIPLIALKMHRFPWNNFMHNVVFDLVQQVFNGRLANWDEDQASHQEETAYDDNLSLNKVLIWSLFGDFEDFEHVDALKDSAQDNHPGYFNLPNYILYCFRLSEQKEKDTKFKLGYMGHLTLIAEEVHKFQNYVENFGMARDDQTFSLLKEESDSSSVFYLKSSFYVFNTLYERIFESGRFKEWNTFVNTTLKELNSMYNKVLGNPNDIGTADEVPVSAPPTNENAIVLDNGDSEEFHHGVEVIEGEEGEDES